MTDVISTLTAAEVDYLAECEDHIERGLQTFVEVGTALAMIRDNKLYRADHGTFAEYCEARWGFSDRRARQIIDAAAIGTIVPVENEGQARELARVPGPDRARIWEAAVEATDGKPTAAAIRAAAPSSPGPATSPAAQPKSDGRLPRPSSGGIEGVPVGDGGPVDARAVTSASEAPTGVPASVGAGEMLGTDPVGEWLSGDPTLPVTAWRKQYMAAIHTSGSIVTFSPAQVAEKADPDLVAEVHRLAADLSDYARRVDLQWRQRNAGLRLVSGGGR